MEFAQILGTKIMGQLLQKRKKKKKKVKNMVEEIRYMAGKLIVNFLG